MKMKTKLESEVEEWRKKVEEQKTKNVSAEWKQEKELLEKQLGIAKSQIEENKKLYESLKSVIDKTELKGSIEELQDQLEANKNVSSALGKVEKKVQVLELKVERLKRFQRMVKSSVSLQCKFCSNVLASEVFSAHLSVCTKDRGQNHLSYKTPLRIKIARTLIREEGKSRPYTVSA